MYEFSTTGHDMLNKCVGPNKSLYLKLFSESFFNRHNPDYNFNDPNWHLLYKKPSAYLDIYHDKVIELLKIDVTTELFKLSYTELMHMDMPTFNKISKVIREIVEDRQRQREMIEKNEDTLKRKAERENRSKG